MTEFDGARAMKRLLAAALLVPVGLIAGCSNSNPGGQAVPSSQASASGQGAGVAPQTSTDALDACQDMEAQAFLAEYAENDFIQAFNTLAPDYDAKRAAFVVAAKNAVQKVADGLPSNVPDPPLSAIRQWMDAERAYINATETQGIEDIYHAHEGALQSFNAAQGACSSVKEFQ
jgi:hypothetical protein